MRGRGALAALALVLVTNAFVLASVAWNRSGEPQATLDLTERELPLSYSVVSARENTGMSLRLNLHSDSYMPDWLGVEKLRELGFTVPDVIADRAERWKEPLPRPAWVVLEFEGPAWEAVLRDKEAQLALARASDDARDEFGNPVERLEKNLASARKSASRLVAVDAGLDAQALRDRYPDRSRNLVVGADVSVQSWRSPSLENDARWTPRGRLRLYVRQIHVPLQHANIMRDIIDDSPRRARTWEPGWSPRYLVRVNYGNRYEPWIDGVEAINGERR